MNSKVFFSILYVCLGVLSSNCEEAETREVCRGRGGAVGCHRDLPAAARGLRGAADAGRLEAAASSCGVFGVVF